MKKQVIDFAGQPVGIVVPDENADKLRFIAVKFHVHELDNHLFDTPEDVVQAIAVLPGQAAAGYMAAY